MRYGNKTGKRDYWMLWGLVLLVVVIGSIVVFAVFVRQPKRSKRNSNDRVFVLTRHGYRGPTMETPQTTLEIGSPVVPPSVPMPSFGAVYEGTLLAQTLSHTLPSVVRATSRVIGGKPNGKDVATYGDAAFSRCWQTAVGWAEELDAPTIGGVTTTVGVTVDPRVNHRAAEANITDQTGWIADQETAAEGFASEAQCVWNKLLDVLGFHQTGPGPIVVGSSLTALDAKGRALQFLGLPEGTFEFCTTVVISFAVVGKTSPQVLGQAGWPKPKNLDPEKWIKLSGRVLGLVMAVMYPKGTVGNIMSAPVSRFALETLDGKIDDVGRVMVACTHEEHINFWLAALGVGSPVYYPLPLTSLILRRRHNVVGVCLVHNRIKDGRISDDAEIHFLGQIPIIRLMGLANISIAPLPIPTTISTFGNQSIC